MDLRLAAFFLRFSWETEGAQPVFPGRNRRLTKFHPPRSCLFRRDSISWPHPIESESGYMMTFSQKLTALRKREGLSQEQLADRLGVTRQSVSKWESGSALPELVKLISLSDIFGVSVDYLVKDVLEEDAPGHRSAGSEDGTARLERKVEDLARYVRGSVYAYDSKTRLFGVPLVSVRIGSIRGGRLRWEHVAKGIFAVGNAAIGVVSLGLVSIGVVSVGAIALGLLALGGIAMGAVSLGVVAFGLLALGVSAIGMYAGGVCAVGSEVAVGVAAAAGKTAVGFDASAPHVLLWGDGVTADQAEQFLLAHHPDLWRPLARLLSALAAHIR